MTGYAFGSNPLRARSLRTQLILRPRLIKRRESEQKWRRLSFWLGRRRGATVPQYDHGASPSNGHHERAAASVEASS
jgi:hypothetical protein